MTRVNSTQERRFKNAVKAGDIPTMGRMLDLHPEYRHLKLGRSNLIEYCLDLSFRRDCILGHLIPVAVFLAERGVEVAHGFPFRHLLIHVCQTRSDALLERLLEALKKQKVELNSSTSFEGILNAVICWCDSSMTVTQIRLFQRYHVDINRCDSRHKTPLCNALERIQYYPNKYGLSAKLAECGADVNVECAVGSAMDYVRRLYPPPHPIYEGLNFPSVLRRQLLPFLVPVLNVYQVPELVISFL